MLVNEVMTQARLDKLKPVFPVPVANIRRPDD